jgi:hypothetical protein
MHNQHVIDTKTVAHIDIDPGTTQTTVRVPDELHVRAKVAGAQAGITLQQLFLEGMELRLSLLESDSAGMVQTAKKLGIAKEEA